MTEMQVKALSFYNNSPTFREPQNIDAHVSNERMRYTTHDSQNYIRDSRAYSKNSQTEKKRISSKHSKFILLSNIESQSTNQPQLAFSNNEGVQPKIQNDWKSGASPNIMEYKNLLNDGLQVDEAQTTQKIIEEQMNMMNSPSMQDTHTSKIVQFYESIIFKMSEEMQKLILYKCKLKQSKYSLLYSLKYQ